MGCQVEARVTQDTTLLVVGDQDVRRLAGHNKSNKHRKAEELILEGSEHPVCCENSDFQATFNQWLNAEPFLTPARTTLAPRTQSALVRPEARLFLLTLRHLLAATLNPLLYGRWYRQRPSEELYAVA